MPGHCADVERYSPWRAFSAHVCDVAHALLSLPPSLLSSPLPLHTAFARSALSSPTAPVLGCVFVCMLML